MQKLNVQQLCVSRPSATASIRKALGTLGAKNWSSLQ